jgi:UDP-glucose 4-epimerase
MKILVTGAAGFIGSVVTEQLVEAGHQVIAVDNLSSGHKAAVHPGAKFMQADLRDPSWIKLLFQTQPIEAVVHLAAEALVDLSMRDPGRFFQVNVAAGLNLIDAMVEAGVQRLVYSSTAAVYGEPKRIPITEKSHRKPVNPYGASKLAFEEMLNWYALVHGLKYISLRYFNACGATGRFGEYHIPETHIIPILLETALAMRDTFCLNGTDYDTPDGTCIRDYIHVSDIAHAHLLALEKMDVIGPRIFNMGNGSGYSNRQVIETVERVTGQQIKVEVAPRRSGEPARLVASSARIQEELGWIPKYPDLAAMIETAWTWRQRYPKGYESA